MPDYSADWDWLGHFTNLEQNLAALRNTRLERMAALVTLRGHPERQSLAFHVAGSKGKGSTSAYIAALLEARGFTTGLYQSPHVVHWHERITHAGKPWPPQVYHHHIRQLQRWWQRHSAEFINVWGSAPTTFEWLTLCAMEIFTGQNVQARVWETGLGGRLDATSVQTPSACVITRIELEHTEILGNTLALIAGEKAGIFKRGVPVFCAPQKPEVLAVLRQKAAEVGAPFYEWDHRWTLPTSWNLGMLGDVQRLNAAVALWAVSQTVGPVPGAQSALRHTALPARTQVIRRHPLVLVDGAHTSESMAELAKVWQNLVSTDQPTGTLVFGAFVGKDVGAMATEIAGVVDHVIVTKPGDFRPSDPDAVAAQFAQFHPRVRVISDPVQALKTAYNTQGAVLVAGSFYLAGIALSHATLMPDSP